MTRRSIAALSLSLCAALALSACAGSPWVDTRREAGSVLPVGESTVDRVAICHAGPPSQPEIQALAAAECAKTGRTPMYVGTRRLQCRLVTPHRSFFQCR